MRLKTLSVTPLIDRVNLLCVTHWPSPPPARANTPLDVALKECDRVGPLCRLCPGNMLSIGGSIGKAECGSIRRSNIELVPKGRFLESGSWCEGTAFVKNGSSMCRRMSPNIDSNSANGSVNAK